MSGWQRRAVLKACDNSIAIDSSRASISEAVDRAGVAEIDDIGSCRGLVILYDVSVDRRVDSACAGLA